MFCRSQVVCTQSMELLSWNRGVGTASKRRWDFSAPRLCWEGQLFWKHRKQLKHHRPTVTFQRNKQLLLLFYKLENTCFPECLEILLMERTKSKYFSFWESLMAPSVKWVMLSVCQEKNWEGWLSCDIQRLLFLLCRSLVWDMFMLSFGCRFTLFWDPAGLFLFNTKDLTNILGESREYFILIISLEGMYPQQSAYWLHAPSPSALHAEILWQS